MVGAGAVIPYDGVSPGDLAQRIGVPRCVVFSSVTSTLDIVHSLAHEGAPDGTLVLAEEQVAGRGRHGRRWHSPPGAGIWLGFLRRLARQPESGLIALRVGLAICESLSERGVETLLKWPNDIVVCDRKLGGVLCEARSSDVGENWIAIGIGLNIRGPLPTELRETAIALESVVSDPRRIDVLEELIPRLARLSEAPTLTRTEIAAYRARDWLNGRRLAAPVEGTVRGVAEDGALVVESAGRIRHIRGGSVVPA
jgi:BirA family biotin operon repressor/biotin-[acetyl-CoA-carboxylase] ligase